MLTVCLSVDTLRTLDTAGHIWVHLNWALGLRAAGAGVIWMEGADPARPDKKLRARLDALKKILSEFDLDDRIALYSRGSKPLPSDLTYHLVDFEEAAAADLLLNFSYGMPESLVCRFRRSALVDIDPGLLQIWIREGGIHMARHDAYFTIGENVAGEPGWRHTFPCVALDQWPKCPAAPDAPFTTVTNWWTGEMVADGGETYGNDKRFGFAPFLDLPAQVSHPVELALCVAAADEPECEKLRRRGWRIRNSAEVAGTVSSYRRYVQQSRGEFSCAKPSCMRLQNAWISDRTLCYLASGKPAVVQHTGPSAYLPDDAGLFRFRSMSQAVKSLDAAASDYERHAALAHSLAREYFDSQRVIPSLLQDVL